MDVLVFASRKGGSGKSTLAAHLAAQALKPRRRAILFDIDPQGSLSLWHQVRDQDELALRRGTRNFSDALAAAAAEGYSWAFVDTPPNNSAAVTEAIRQATLVVIPTRPNFFDLAAVHSTIEIAREHRKPYAVVINAAPPKRDGVESAAVALARQGLQDQDVPVWSGQITHRGDFALALRAGDGVKDFDPASSATVEMAQLWSAIERSVRAINGAYASARAMHTVAA